MSPTLITLAIVAVVTLIALPAILRAGNVTLSKKAFADRTARIATLRAMQAVGAQLRDEPDSPETPARKVEFARLKACYQSDAGAAHTATRLGLAPLLFMNIVMTVVGDIVLLLLAGYLIVAHFSAVSILAAAIIVAIVAYTLMTSVRARRAWNLYSIPPEPEGPRTR